MDVLEIQAIAKLRATPSEGRAGPPDPGRHTVPVLCNGSMELRWFKPDGPDPQTPHDRDEMYFIVSGHGLFMRARDVMPIGDDVSLPVAGEERARFKAGDVLFVPAGTEHRFEEMSEDFGCWIVFYGPEGGEHT